MDSYISERDIWLINLNPTKGIEIQKVRPCLVLKKFSHVHFVVVPITSKKKSENFAIKIDTELLKEQENYVNISHIRSVDRCRFIRRYGQISDKKFFQVKKKTVEVLELLPQGADAHNVK